MSSIQYFRNIITERLTAAAAEIFRHVEQTVIEYEEELDRQRKLLEIVWKPHVNLQRIELPHRFEEPESLQIKEEQEEICTSHEEEQLEVKQEADTLMMTSDNEESDHMEPEPDNNHQLLCHSSPVAESQDQTGSDHVGKNTIEHEEDVGLQHRPFHVNRSPVIKLHRTDLPQQHVCKEEEVLTEQQFCDQERNSSLDQEEPEALQKDEHKEISTSHEGEQIKLKQQADTLMLTSDNEEGDHMEQEPDSDHQLISHSSLAESQDQTGRKHVEALSHKNAESKPHQRSDGNKIDNYHTSSTESETRTHKESLKCDKSELVSHTRGHTAEKPFSCKTCAKCFRTRYQLLLHMRTHTGEMPYSCDTCGKCFRQSSNLLKHKKTHTGEKPYSCKICGKCFRQSVHLINHEKTHTVKKPYSCETCGECFTRISDFVAHERTHKVEKPYSCETCGECFKHNSSLIKHKRFHIGEKPYSCEICGKCFRQSSNFIKHKRIHTGEKPYSCKTCGKCFSQSSNLMVHERIHTFNKPYSCETCGKRCTQRWNLMMHKRIHTREKRWHCKTCGMSFVNRSSLKRHLHNQCTSKF